jgi:hypothetical protein
MIAPDGLCCEFCGRREPAPNGAMPRGWLRVASSGPYNGASGPRTLCGPMCLEALREAEEQSMQAARIAYKRVFNDHMRAEIERRCGAVTLLASLIDDGR